MTFVNLSRTLSCKWPRLQRQAAYDIAHKQEIIDYRTIEINAYFTIEVVRKIAKDLIEKLVKEVNAPMTILVDGDPTFVTQFVWFASLTPCVSCVAAISDSYGSFVQFRPYF